MFDKSPPLKSAYMEEYRMVITIQHSLKGKKSPELKFRNQGKEQRLNW